MARRPFPEVFQLVCRGSKDFSGGSVLQEIPHRRTEALVIDEKRVVAVDGAEAHERGFHAGLVKRRGERVLLLDGEEDVPLHAATVSRAVEAAATRASASSPGIRPTPAASSPER